MKGINDRLILWRRSLLAYVEHGSQSKAAANLKIDPVTLLSHLEKLEARYEHLLVRDEKGRRTPVLNEYGKDWLRRFDELSAKRESGLGEKDWRLGGE